VLRDDDIIARLGGDEFAIYLGGVPNEATATRIARKIHDALAAPFNSAGIILDVEASVGIAVAPDHGTDVHRLMQRADVAMYSAKRSKAGFEVYDESVDPHSADRLSLTADLRRAVDNNEFLLHYQPKALLSDGRVEGVEALLRWQHPERGMVPPGVFIPIAEDNGLMKPITLWVVDEALRQAGKWRRDGLGLTISVNISVQNLHDASLTDDIAELLSKHDAEADWLRLEITESAVMEGPESALLRLAGLADMGLELSMDDYGTGYSSLTYLKQMPLSELKIDRSFVQNITADQKDALIVGSTIELGHSLGLRVVAEGVEREEDWIGLQMLGCDVAQGFFLGRPMPPEGLEAWLQENDRPYIKVTPLER
jgi:EAL domain-containing protein (putative c-di-GMP-specific phosphodiesterase class I)